MTAPRFIEYLMHLILFAYIGFQTIMIYEIEYKKNIAIVME